MATELRTFVDTDVLIDVARKFPRTVDFWRRHEARSRMECSVVSAFELLAGCRNLREQQATVRSLATVVVDHADFSVEPLNGVSKGGEHPLWSRPGVNTPAAKWLRLLDITEIESGDSIEAFQWY